MSFRDLNGLLSLDFNTLREREYTREYFQVYYRAVSLCPLVMKHADPKV